MGHHWEIGDDPVVQDRDTDAGIDEEMEGIMGFSSPQHRPVTYADNAYGTGGNREPVDSGRRPWENAGNGANMGNHVDGRDFGDSSTTARPPRYTSDQANAGPSNSRGPLQRRARREKFMPPEERTEEELYCDQIETGEGFDEYVAINNSINVSCLRNGHTPVDIPLAESFKECGFPNEILANLERFDYETPSAVQSAVLPAMLLLEDDLVVSADTGSGKSAAWLLPIIHTIQHQKSNGAPGSQGHSPYALVLLPTKELTEHMYKYTRGLTANTSVTAARSYGDMPMPASVASIRSGCDIYFGTCGRTRHLILTDKLLQMNQVRWLIFDEADKMVSNDEFFTACEEINECIMNRRAETGYRRLMFSATFENMFRIEKFIRENFITIVVGERNRAAPTVRQDFMEVPKYDKPAILVEILRSGRTVEEIDGVAHSRLQRTIVFVNTRRMCERIAILLAQKGIRVFTLNSDRVLQQRLTAVKGFSQNVFQVLVATDVASRGLNFPNVDLVINYELPPVDNESYIHRVGRTGRAGNAGHAITFFDPMCTTDRRMAEFLVQTLRNGGDGANPVPSSCKGSSMRRRKSASTSSTTFIRLRKTATNKYDTSDTWRTTLQALIHFNAAELSIDHGRINTSTGAYV